MIGLYLLAAHLFGDFILQNRFQAALKLASRAVRAQHVAGYVLPFIPLAALYASSWARGAGFLAALAVLHYAADSRRFRSTLGDVIQWAIDYQRAPAVCRREWFNALHLGSSIQEIDLTSRTVRWPTPNPWPPTPLLIDQSLHVAQLALLGGLFLS